MKFFTGWRAARDRAAILDSLSRIEQRQIQMAGTEADLEAKVQKLSDDIATAVSTQQATTAELRAEIAMLQAGQPVSQEQLDSLSAKVDAMDVAVQPLLPAPSTTAAPATT
jgi:seryl-tRNA synthetase